MPNIIFNISLYFTGITKLTATAFVARSVERWSRDPGSRVQFPSGGLGVAFSATGPGWVLKCISLSEACAKRHTIDEYNSDEFNCFNYIRRSLNYIRLTRIIHPTQTNLMHEL